MTSVLGCLHRWRDAEKRKREVRVARTPRAGCAAFGFYLAGTHRGGAEDWSSYAQIEKKLFGRVEG